MRTIRFEPSLSRCIQTMAREEYNKIKDELLVADHISEAQSTDLEMLREFLETADFGSLRRDYEPNIQAGRRVMIALTSTDNGIDCQVEIL